MSSKVGLKYKLIYRQKKNQSRNMIQIQVTVLHPFSIFRDVKVLFKGEHGNYHYWWPCSSWYHDHWYVMPFNISYVTECYGQSLPKWWHLHFKPPIHPILHCPPFKSHQVMFGSFWQKFPAAGHFQILSRGHDHIWWT